MAAHHNLAADNFLIPGWTFVAELIAFVIILYLIARYIVPPVQKVMRERQEMIAQQGRDADAAKEKRAEAEQAYASALTDARVESAQIRENARAEAQRTVEDLRKAAQEEAARIVARGEEQLARQRATVVRELRAEVGTLAVELAEKIVHERLANNREVSTTVDSFIAGLDAADTAATASADSSAGTSTAP